MNNNFKNKKKITTCNKLKNKMKVLNFLILNE